MLKMLMTMLYLETGENLAVPYQDPWGVCHITNTAKKLQNCESEPKGTLRLPEVQYLGNSKLGLFTEVSKQP